MVMAFSRVSVAVFLLMVLLASTDILLIEAVRPGFDVVQAGAGRSLLATIDCRSACARRCQLSSRPNLCKRACGTCCARCNCVPPDTYGNKEVCPCYAQMTTHGGQPKCP